MEDSEMNMSYDDIACINEKVFKQKEELGEDNKPSLMKYYMIMAQILILAF